MGILAINLEYELELGPAEPTGMALPETEVPQQPKETPDTLCHRLWKLEDNAWRYNGLMWPSTP